MMSWYLVKIAYFLVVYVQCYVQFVQTADSDGPLSQSVALRQHFSGYPSTVAGSGQSSDYLKFQPKTKCPCDDPRWCNPIEKNYEHEVFVFAVRNYTSHWMNYDWSKVTTVVLFGFMDHKLVCHAHKNGARAVTLGNFPVANLTNTTQRSIWVKGVVNFIRDNYLDGVNFDIEEPIPKSDKKRINALTSLVAETSNVLKALNRFYQVTYDVAWSPDCIDGRCYDIIGLSKIVDFLFIMSYDEQSQIFGKCMAMANSPYIKTVGGVKKFLDLGIKPSTLVLGLPWYGYDYECISLQNNVCTIKHVPFRGVNCSDAAGNQLNLATITGMVDKSLTGRLWDEKSLSPYFSYKAASGKIHQIWYDDPVSLKLKYDYAVRLGMRGVGMWNADSVSYGNTALNINERAATWGVLPGCGKM